ncbi:phospholipase D/transphosphatidylase [Caballeronia catudaia]|uniref:Phospholipase D/transphosphatidylase n=1 Tax=Caballeronia catudaia TaxID=1777136 RepID=A0A158AJD6_9BURK|nr:phospholipase D-like domain-containing protein [Caballeronia catudaia]SAK57938.1 phospholipase D/transphosphatidylase [Caballeronia catudaia]
MIVNAKENPTGNLFDHEVPTIRQLVDSASNAYKAYATENVWVLNGPQQFALPRYGNKVTPFTSGEDYFADLCDAIATAQSTIYIADWMINWDAQMKPGGDGANVRLFDVLLASVKSNAELKIYVMPWAHAVPVQTYDKSTKTVFEAINKLAGRECVWVTLAGALADDDSGFFSHHQKFVVIDEKIAFVGGMDLCYGRFDDATFDLKADAKGRAGMNRYNGCAPHLGAVRPDQVVNPFKFDACMLKRVEAGALQVEYRGELPGLSSISSPGPSYMTLDSTIQPRMPWQDVNVRIEGPSAYDVARNFVMRWNSEGYHVESQSVHRNAGSTVPSRRVRGNKILLSFPPEPDQETGHCGVQVLRSAPERMRKTEYSYSTFADRANLRPPSGKQCEIALAMRNLIRQATSFIYIENQFFVSGFVSELAHTNLQASDIVTSQPLSAPAALIAGKGMAQWATRKLASHAFEAPKNFICEELGNRIGRTIMAGVKEHFHVIITLPVHPEGMLNDGTIMTQVHWTMQSLVFGSFSLLNRVRRFIKAKQLFDNKVEDWKKVLSDVNDLRYQDVDMDDCREYVTLLNLRNWEKLGDRYVTEQIYVHNKTMIVDDRYAIVGSANINDRSMLGSRDSELAVLIADTEAEQYDIDGSGQTKITRKFARTLRMALWNKIFGVTGNVRPADSLRQAVEQPADPKSWKAIQQVADANTALYEAAFPFIPRNNSYGAEDDPKYASIWPSFDSSNVNPEEAARRASRSMPFDSNFWNESQHMPKASSLAGVRGFVTSLPIFWTKGENNNMRYATSLVAESEPERMPTDVSMALSHKKSEEDSA